MSFLESRKKSLFVLLLVTCALPKAQVMLAQGQSNPAWIEHAWSNRSGGLAKVFSMAESNGNVVLVGQITTILGGATIGGRSFNFDERKSVLLSFAEDGELNWVKEGSLPIDTSIPIPGVGFHLIEKDNYLYTNEGYPQVFDAQMLTAGGISTNKYSETGDLIWTSIIDESIMDPTGKNGYIVGLGVDELGNIYSGGIYGDSLVIGSDTLFALSQTGSQFIGDTFLSSHDNNGNLRWAKRVGGAKHDVIAGWGNPRGAFAVDSQGTVHFGGFFSAGALFGEGQTNETTLLEDAYALASYDSEGEFIRVLTANDLGISDNAGPFNIAIDPQGYLIVDWFVLSSGNVNVVTVGDTTLRDPGFGGEFLTKISSDGTIEWVKQIKSDGNESVLDMHVDQRGDIYVGGWFDGLNLWLEGETLTKQDLQLDGSDGFVARLNTDGDLVWIDHVAGASNQSVTSLTVSESGALYLGGVFSNTMRLGEVVLTSAHLAGQELFLAKYDAATITSAELSNPQSSPPPMIEIFPNPNSSGSINFGFTLEEEVDIRLSVHDMVGREVGLLVEAGRPAGKHYVQIDLSGLAKGVYFYRLNAGSAVTIGSFVFVN